MEKSQGTCGIEARTKTYAGLKRQNCLGNNYILSSELRMGVLCRSLFV